MTAGRPPKITSEVLQKLEYAFMMGCTDTEACLYADIGTSTLYDYQNNHPEFTERKEQLKDNLKLRSKLNLGESITVERDVDNSKWYLERKAKNEFSTKVEQDVTSKGQQIKDATTVLLSKVPQELLEQALEEVEAVTNSPVDSNKNE